MSDELLAEELIAAAIQGARDALNPEIHERGSMKRDEVARRRATSALVAAFETLASRMGGLMYFNGGDVYELAQQVRIAGAVPDGAEP